LTACLIVISFSAFSFEAFAAPLPDIEVLGKGTVIANGDSSPDISDDTDFESTFVSSSLVKTFTITNTGGQDLNLTGDPIVQVSGSSTFSVSSQPGSSVVLGSASVTFDVQFLPDSDGMHNATISIASNDGDENPYTFSIKGTGLGTPEMAVFGNGTEILNGDTTPDPADHTDFDSTGIGNPKEKTFTIENTGNADLDLTGTPLVQLSGSSGFSVSQQPLTDPVPAGTTTFIVRFVPDSVGEHTATVTIPNDDGDENPYTFSIKGTGFTAPPTLSNPTVASIDTTSAYLGADIASNGGDPIYDYGVYWNTVSPAESGTKCQKSMTDPGTGTYTVSCGSMLIGTKIYFKGYATNSVGTGYTPEDYFYTEPLQASNVQISAFTDESMTITWDNDPTSSGAIVVMSTSSSLSLPEDKPYDVGDSWTVYDVEIEEYLIVYSGSGSSVDVGGLDATTSYYIWVYAYSGSGEEINYQQDSPEQTAALRQWQLTTTVDPPGNGNLSPDCTAGCMYTENTQVVVTAYEFDFPFYRWIGCDQSSGLSCTMTMNWDRSLTAEYWSCAFPVLTAGTPTGFNTLQGGYNSAVAGDTIFAENTLFDGDFYVNASKTVFFEGGYDCVFDSVVGTTIVKGDMFVSGGKFTVDYGKLQVGLWVVVNDNCMECHGQVQGSYRQITGSGGDFVKNSHHVSDGTSNEIVTDEDCIVCHAEESNDGLHTNGYIDLKDADYYVPATGESGPLGIFTLGDGQGEPGTGSWSDDRDLTIFCLSCHDADGASVTFRTGGTALNPFNDGLTNSHEPFGMDGAPAPHSRPRVVDVNSLLDPL
jgi:hypothetical protein